MGQAQQREQDQRREQAQTEQAQTVQAQNLAGLSAGDRIEVNYQGKGKWFPATHRGPHPNGNSGFISVEYDDTPGQILGATEYRPLRPRKRVHWGKVTTLGTSTGEKEAEKYHEL